MLNIYKKNLSCTAYFFLKDENEEINREYEEASSSAGNILIFFCDLVDLMLI